jgi:hypothetical protein
MEAFSSILGGLGKFGGALGQGASALGPVTGLFGMINQFSQAQKQKALTDRQIYYAKHPEAVSNLVAQDTKPLSSGLTSSVSNVVNANLAEQGLSQAPGIQTQVLSQALAPYQQQEQQFAIQEAFKSLGLPAEALASLNSTMNPGGLAAMLKNILPGSGSSSPSGGTPGFQIPNTDPSGGSWGGSPSDTGVTFPSIGDLGGFVG